MHLSKNLRFIVTGGAGFIGSCIVKALNDRGITDIVVVDALGTEDKWRNLSGKFFSHYLHKDQLFNWLIEHPSEKPDAVIHMGACSSTVERDVDYLMANNYDYTVRLASLCVEKNIRFIYASSAATYGDGSRGFSDDHEGLRELIPLNPYGFSKHRFDIWALDKKLLGQITGVKFFNVYGPNEYHKGRMASVVYGLLPQIVNEGVLRLFRSNDPERFKDGEQCRDFIYVKDAARLVLELLEADLFGIYNIGSGRAETWNALAEAMFAAVNQPVKIEYRDLPEDLRGKYQNYTQADMSKLRKKLPGFQTTPLNEAVFDYIRHYLLSSRVY